MRWWWLVGLAGCLGGPQSLADLHATKAIVYGSDTITLSNIGPSLSVLLETPDCTPLADDVRASFGTLALTFERDAHDGGCLGWRASLQDLPPGAFDGVDTSLTIRDRTETWTIALPGLHDANVGLSAPVIRGQSVAVTWENGPRIDIGHFHLVTSAGALDEVSTTNGGWQLPDAAGAPAVVDVPATAAVGTARATIELYGSYAPDAVHCQGPASCELGGSVEATFDVTITN